MGMCIDHILCSDYQNNKNFQRIVLLFRLSYFIKFSFKKPTETTHMKIFYSRYEVT